jgi:hypothetical protein
MNWLGQMMYHIAVGQVLIVYIVLGFDWFRDFLGVTLQLNKSSTLVVTARCGSPSIAYYTEKSAQIT